MLKDNHLILFTPTKPQMTAVTVCPYWSKAACLNNKTRPECQWGVQGTCEWMEGILKTQGSLDISPPSDTVKTGVPAQAPEAANANVEQPAAAAAAPEDASPILENEPEAAPIGEAGQALEPEASITFNMTVHGKAAGEGPWLRQAQVHTTPCVRMLDAALAALHCIVLLSSGRHLHVPLCHPEDGIGGGCSVSLPHCQHMHCNDSRGCVSLCRQWTLQRRLCRRTRL